MTNKFKRPQYTTAFIGIAVSGEIYVIRQFKGTAEECREWRNSNEVEVCSLYKNAVSVTIEHIDSK